MEGLGSLYEALVIAADIVVDRGSDESMREANREAKAKGCVVSLSLHSPVPVLTPSLPRSLDWLACLEVFTKYYEKDDHSNRFSPTPDEYYDAARQSVEQMITFPPHHAVKTVKKEGSKATQISPTEARRRRDVDVAWFKSWLQSVMGAMDHAVWRSAVSAQINYVVVRCSFFPLVVLPLLVPSSFSSTDTCLPLPLAGRLVELLRRHPRQEDPASGQDVVEVGADPVSVHLPSYLRERG